MITAPSNVEKAQWSRVSLYNSHCLAASRATDAAYGSDSTLDHTVAASRHEMAAEAARSSQELHEVSSSIYEYYKYAIAYHNAQALEHREAVSMKNLSFSDREPAIVGAALQAVVVAAVLLAVQFGIPLSDGQQAAILGLSLAVISLVTTIVVRNNVTPVAKLTTSEQEKVEKR